MTSKAAFLTNALISILLFSGCKGFNNAVNRLTGKDSAQASSQGSNAAPQNEAPQSLAYLEGLLDKVPQLNEVSAAKVDSLLNTPGWVQEHVGIDLANSMVYSMMLTPNDPDSQAYKVSMKQDPNHLETGESGNVFNFLTKYPDPTQRTIAMNKVARYIAAYYVVLWYQNVMQWKIETAMKADPSIESQLNTYLKSKGINLAVIQYVQSTTGSNSAWKINWAGDML